jgi:hypothetical protein
LIFFSIENKTPWQSSKLHRVHEGALDFFEHDDAEEKERGGDCGGDSETLPWDCAAEEDGAETLNDGGHGVEIHEESVFFWNHAGWVDDGGGIHGELDTETDEEGEIAVFCGERGDDDTGSEAEQGHDPKKNGRKKENHGPIGMEIGSFDRVVSEKGKKEQKLDTKLDEVGDDNRKGRDKPGKVDFAEDAGIRHKGGGGFCEAGGKVVPRSDTGEVEKHGRKAIRRQLSQAAEDYCKNEGGQDGLDKKPERTEDGLLVDGDKVAPHEHPKQVAVVLDIAELQIPPSRGGVEHHIPVFVIGVGRCHSVVDCGRKR